MRIHHCNVVSLDKIENTVNSEVELMLNKNDITFALLQMCGSKKVGVWPELQKEEALWKLMTTFNINNIIFCS